MAVTKTVLIDYIYNLAQLIADEQLKSTLIESVAASQDSITEVEYCFALLPSHRRSDEQLAQFLNSWKATHLKMLAIYGLSCRLQRLAMATQETSIRAQLMLASTYNAETSYEDLGLDFGGQTHTQLYNDLAYMLVGNFPWSLEQYCIPEARQFRGWIYHNMVIADIQIGLSINIFSEIYNYAEYNVALGSFSELIDRHYHFSTAERKRVLQYVDAHVAENTELAHFLVVVKALNAYCEATQTSIDYSLIKVVFQEYLSRIGTVMGDLSKIMEP